VGVGAPRERAGVGPRPQSRKADQNAVIAREDRYASTL
jgi:hypothetical protein